MNSLLGTICDFLRFSSTSQVLSLLLQVLLLPGMAIFLSVFFHQLTVFLLKTGAIAAVEEGGKFLLLLWFSCSAGPFHQSRQSSKAVMLRGFSLGVGYMARENLGYFQTFALALDDRRVWQLNARYFEKFAIDLDDEYWLSGEIPPIRSAILQFICFKIFFDTHAYLTGIAAGRFAKIASDIPSGQRLTAGMWLKVLWPSALLHVLQAGGPLSTILCCVISFKVFQRTWNSLDEPASVRKTLWNSSPVSQNVALRFQPHTVQGVLQCSKVDILGLRRGAVRRCSG